jgi:hypothetical protein
MSRAVSPGAGRCTYAQEFLSPVTRNYLYKSIFERLLSPRSMAIIKK